MLAKAEKTGSGSILNAEKPPAPYMAQGANSFNR